MTSSTLLQPTQYPGPAVVRLAKARPLRAYALAGGTRPGALHLAGSFGEAHTCPAPAGQVGLTASSGPHQARREAHLRAPGPLAPTPKWASKNPTPPRLSVERPTRPTKIRGSQRNPAGKRGGGITPPPEHQRRENPKRTGKLARKWASPLEGRQ